MEHLAAQSVTKENKMQADLYPQGSQLAVEILTLFLQDKKRILSKDERLDLEQFIDDLQEALNEEAERQWHLSQIII